ncbi:hypothetical protein OH77DRAFT_1594477 [Trametes cingulata]|nr:hypothetical protein OH77DRAFT_1594477 [Trametes cingulata]
MGILIGDPASPTLWILYISDFALRPHPDDVFLAQRRVSHFELADDMAMISLSHWGMQSKLQQFEDYCSVNFLLANVLKTLASVHGPLPLTLPALLLYGTPLRYVETATLVGITLTSSAHDIFSVHTTQKAAVASRVSNACFSLEAYGPVCDLERVQHTYLRRSVNISSHCQLSSLFSETGIWPIRYRRLHLALRYLQYILRDRPPLPYAAFCEQWQLASHGGHPSWWGDLHAVAAALPVPVHIPLDVMPTLDTVSQALDDLRESLAQHLYIELMRSLRLPVLQHRLQRDLQLRPSSLLEHVCSFRDYLQLPSKSQRDAMALLLFSEHPLAVERLRRVRPAIDRSWRVCRFCREPWAIEDEVHTLLQCSAPILCDLRDQFFAAAQTLHAGLRKLYFRLSGAAFLDVVLRSSEVLPLFAHFVARVFALCDELPQLLLRSEDELLALAVPHRAALGNA